MQAMQPKQNQAKGAHGDRGGADGHAGKRVRETIMDLSRASTSFNGVSFFWESRLLQLFS
jgi:hypothetical protein